MGWIYKWRTRKFVGINRRRCQTSLFIVWKDNLFENRRNKGFYRGNRVPQKESLNIKDGVQGDWGGVIEKGGGKI